MSPGMISIFLHQFCRIQQKDAGDLQRGFSAEDCSLKTFSNQPWEISAVIEVCVRQDDRVDVVRVKGQETATPLVQVLNRAEPGAALNRSLAAYAEALEAYEAGRFAEAEKGFANVVRLDPVDATAAMMRERCRLLHLHPPADWGGVWTLDDQERCLGVPLIEVADYLRERSGTHLTKEDVCERDRLPDGFYWFRNFINLRGGGHVRHGIEERKGDGGPDAAQRVHEIADRALVHPRHSMQSVHPVTQANQGGQNPRRRAERRARLQGRAWRCPSP